MKVIDGRYNKNATDQIFTKFAIVVLAIALLGSFISKDVLVAKVFMGSYCSIIGISLAIMIINKEESRFEQFYVYLAKGMLLVSIVELVNLVNILQRIIIGTTNIQPVELIISYYRILIIPICIYCYSKNITLKNFVGILFVTLILIVAGLYGIQTKLINIFSIDFINLFRVIVGILLSSICFGKVISRKAEITKVDKNDVLKYCIFTTIYSLLIVQKYFNSNILDLVALIFGYLGYIILFKYIEKRAIDDQHNEVLQELMNIERYEKTLSNKLREKEATLEQLKTQLEINEQSYQDILKVIGNGLFLFKYDRLDNMNTEAYQCLASNLTEDVIDKIETLSLKEVLKELTGDEFTIEELEGGFNKSYKIYNTTQEKIETEFVLVNVNSVHKFLLLVNMTEIIWQKREKENLEIYLLQEDTKEEFYANITHELRTPINVIYSALQLNQLYIEKGTFGRIKSNNQKIKQNCLRLIRTINNFIDCNKIIEGCLDVHKKVYNIVPVVEEVVERSRKYLDKKNISLMFDTMEEEYYLAVDKEQVERVILNILSNCTKYGKSGQDVEVLVVQSKSGIEIRIKHDGNIIPNENKEEIFTSFYKVDASFARESEGSGLGLYLARELVSLNGGRLNVETEENVGSTFIIYIPFVFNMEEWIIDEELDNADLDERVDIEFSDVYYN